MEVVSLLGRVGLPAPIAQLASRDWDAVVVGGGHNGLSAAAYLDRAVGPRVGAEGAARRGVHPRTAFRGRAFRGLPLRVRRRFEACERGEPAVAWAEHYFQTAYDRSVAPAGHQVMSAFAQYAPYELAEGGWDSRREEIGARVLDLIETYAPDVRECVSETQVLGPPDIEQRIGLSGGNIFQGETLPEQMWDRRLAARTPVEGLYPCGAATHPAGSVIALNGRNAAMAVLEDAGVAVPA